MRYILTIGLCLIISCATSYAAVVSPTPVSTASDFSNILSKTLATKVSFHQGIKSMLQHFCTQTLAMDPVVSNGSATSAYLFDPKQSLFLYVLCTDIGAGSGSVFVDTQKYDFIKRRTWAQYNIVLQDTYESEGLCVPSGGLQFCNVPQQFFRVYNDMMSTYIDMFQSEIYGANLPGDSVKDRAQEFTKKYLVGLDICADGNCTYPTTQKRLEQYIKNGQNLRSSVAIIDTKKMIKNTNFDTSACSSFATTPGYDILRCAFYDKQPTPTKAFLNLLTQEHFFFRLFLTYYDYVIQTDSTVWPRTYTSDSLALSARRLKYTQSIQNYISWSKQALGMSLSMLHELRITFPLHIGLLAYYEDLYKLRKELIKAVTPLYTLHDKLKNVQKPE